MGLSAASITSNPESFYIHSSCHAPICRRCVLKGFNPEKVQRKYEALCLAEHGALAFYAKTLLTKEEFEKITYHYSKNYDRLRKQYNCQKAFPHVYDKISCQGRE